MSGILAPVSYAFAVSLFLILAILVVTGWQRRLQSGLLIIAALVSAAWAGVQALQSVRLFFTTEFLFLTEILRDAAWLVFLVSILERAGHGILSPALRWSAYLAPPALLLAGFRGINQRDRLRCNGSTPAVYPRAHHNNPAKKKCCSTKDSSASLRSSAISAMVP